MINYIATFDPEGLPHDVTVWNGKSTAPSDYINGPIYLRDRTIMMRPNRISKAQWTWEDYENPFGSMPDDIVGYIPGYVRTWDGGQEAPSDWEPGNAVIFNDGYPMIGGVQKESTGWQDTFILYVSNETPPEPKSIEETPSSDLQKRINELEECLKQTRLLISIASITGFSDNESLGNLYVNNAEISKLLPIDPEDRKKISEILLKYIK